MAKVAYFSAGCFWQAQKRFDALSGVLQTVVGYQQGRGALRPTYTSAGPRDFAESVRVLYDPNRISYERLLRAFFGMHDPGQLNRQGPDVGRRYRSGVWVVSPYQMHTAIRISSEVRRSHRVFTEIEWARTFWPAAEKHQKYLQQHAQKR